MEVPLKVSVSGWGHPAQAEEPRQKLRTVFAGFLTRMLIRPLSRANGWVMLYYSWPRIVVREKTETGEILT